MTTAAITSYLGSATGHRSYVLLWVRARNRDTNAIEESGLWTGDDHETITVNGVQRLYYGAQGKLDLPDGVTYEAGLDVQMLQNLLGPLTPEVAVMLRGHDPRLAEIEVHIRVDDTDGAQVGIFRAFRGWIDDLSIDTDGGWAEVQTVATLTLASHSREGTRTMAETRSDATRKRNAGDRFARYMAVTGSDIRTPWGAKKV